MIKLYDLDNKYLEIMNQLEESEGEISDELFEEWEQLDSDFKAKCNNYAGLIKNLVAEAEVLKAEKQKLEKKQKSKEKLIDNLKERLTQSFEIQNKDKFDTGIHKISFLTSKKVNIIDEKLLDKKYFTIPEPQVSKSLILTDLKNGEVVEGAELIVNKNIQIK